MVKAVVPAVAEIATSAGVDPDRRNSSATVSSSSLIVSPKMRMLTAAAVEFAGTT